MMFRYHPLFRWTVLLPVAFLIGCKGGDEKESAVKTDRHPTFTKDIAPIIFSECAVCHRPGEPAPFPLLTYRDVRKRADQIVEVTQSRYMPPWLPEQGFGHFEDERFLSEGQIETLRIWAEQGAVEGEAADLPDLPQFTEGWQLGEPDLVLEMPEPFHLPADGKDVYRHFVLDVPISKGRYVEALEFRPGDTRAIHHAFVLVDESGNAVRYDAKDEGPGYGGMDPGIGPAGPSGHFISWQPGKVYHKPVKGMSWKLKRNAKIVLQVHMQTTGKPEKIQAKVGFHFTDEAPSRVPFKIVLRSVEIDIPANDTSEVRNEYKLPVDVQVLGVVPHAHYLGKALHGYAILPDGSKKWLMKIDDWDFNWQGDYRFATPVHLPAGSVIHQHFNWDNTSENPRNPSNPPVPVEYGPETTDEMGELWLQLLPKNSADYAKLNRDYGQRIFDRNRRALEKRIERNPEDVTALTALGKNLMGLGNIPEAKAHLDKAIATDAAAAEAYYIRGLISVRENKLNLAKADFDECVKHRPDHLGGQTALGNILMGTGQYTQAEQHYERAVQIDPESALAHRNFGTVSMRRGRYKKALEHFERALVLEPGNARVRDLMAEARKLQLRESLNQ